MMRRTVLLICSAILFCVAIYLYVKQEGFLHTYKGRGTLDIYSTSTIVTSPGVFIMGVIVFVMGITTPKSIKYSDEEYKKKEKERLKEEQEQFKKYKNRKYN